MNPKCGNLSKHLNDNRLTEFGRFIVKTMQNRKSSLEQFEGSEPWLRRCDNSPSGQLKTTQFQIKYVVAGGAGFFSIRTHILR